MTFVFETSAVKNPAIFPSSPTLTASSLVFISISQVPPFFKALKTLNKALVYNCFAVELRKISL